MLLGFNFKEKIFVVMEKLYRKKSNGRYQEVMSYTDTLQDGIWLVQTKPHSRSISSLMWRVGDTKRLTDVTTHAALQSYEDDLAHYLMKLGDVNSEEYKDAVETVGSGWIKGVIGYTGISASDLCSLFLRRVAINIEKEK
jgi:hypothetical protein